MASGIRRRKTSWKEKIRRVLTMAESKLSEGLYYEAQQIFKAVSPRYLSQGKVKEAIVLLRQGSLNMLKYRQLRCTLDLSNDIIRIEDVHSSKVDYEMESLNALMDILNEFPESKEKDQLLNEAVAWSRKKEFQGIRYEFGHPSLHIIGAQSKMIQKDERGALDHYLRSKSPSEFARGVLSMASEGHTSEKDLFVARAALEILSRGEGILAAEHFLKEVRLELDRRSTDVSSLYLIRYCERLVLALKMSDKGFHLFDTLQKVYSPAFRRDPSCAKLIAMIAKRYYS